MLINFKSRIEKVGEEVNYYLLFFVLNNSILVKELDRLWALLFKVVYGTGFERD